MRGTLKLMSLRLINEKTPLFNLYSSSLWVFGSWWLNSYKKQTQTNLLIGILLLGAFVQNVNLEYETVLYILFQFCF